MSTARSLCKQGKHCLQKIYLNYLIVFQDLDLSSFIDIIFYDCLLIVTNHISCYNFWSWFPQVYLCLCFTMWLIFIWKFSDEIQYFSYISPPLLHSAHFQLLILQVRIVQDLWCNNSSHCNTQRQQQCRQYKLYRRLGR